MIRVGTSGYSYQDWVGNFYPKGIKPALMLKYYSQHFDFTEINSTYYKVPDPKNYFKMAEITPYEFMFSVKLFGAMTHTRDCSEGDYHKFLSGIRNLEECGKLSCLLAQFPNSFYYSEKNMSYLEKLLDRFQGFKLAVEFRNEDMINIKVLKFLRDRDITLVSVDEPKLPGLPRPGIHQTNKRIYVRFHGRNESTWYNNKASYERYDYCYKEKELQEWTGQIKGMEHSCDDLYVSFNNHFNGQAVINAKRMRELLGQI